MAQRITLVVLCILSVLFLPFWTTLALALLGMIYFPLFWEAVAIFFLSDLLYGVPREALFNFTYVSLTMALVGLIAVEIMKKKLKFYPNH